MAERRIKQTIGTLPALPVAPSLERLESFDSEAILFVEGLVKLEQALQQRIQELNQFATEANALGGFVVEQGGEISQAILEAKSHIAQVLTTTQESLQEVLAQAQGIASKIKASETLILSTQASLAPGAINDTLLSQEGTWSSQKISASLQQKEEAINAIKEKQEALQESHENQGRKISDLQKNTSLASLHATALLFN